MRSCKMTKMHFQLIADVVKWFDPELADAERIRMRLAIDFANALARTNPQFNKDKFIEACTRAK